MKLGVEHEDPAALAIFAREIAPAGTSFAPGTTGFAGGRPRPQPVIRLFSFLLPKKRLPTARLAIDGRPAVDVPAFAPPAEGPNPTRFAAAGAPIENKAPSPETGEEPSVTVPLVRIAVARSGDKGDSANIGVVPRDPVFTEVLRRELSAARVAGYFAHLVEGEVTRYEVPGIGGFNFLLTRALGGGGMASLRNDPLGKGLAQMLLDIEVAVPAGLAARLSPP